MARPLRIQYPGAVYHVTSRGNERQDIFKDDDDRKRFLQILIQSIHIYSVKLYSYVLMTNHFHLLVETPKGNLAEFMRKFNITYTGYYNRMHNRVGHLYQGRYKSVLVDKNEYLSVLSRYIHLNPVKIKAMKKLPEKDRLKYLIRYRWSSLPGFLSRRTKEWYVDYAMVLGEYGGDTVKARKEYKKRIYAEIAGDTEIKESIIGQSILGGAAFIAWVKDNYIEGMKDRERPAVREIHRHRTQEEVFTATKQETGKDVDAISKGKGDLRRIVMDLLYRTGGLKGPEIGLIFGIDYGTVSQERKRLREKIQKDRKIRSLMNRIERKLSTNEI
ncbi:MAG: transposase [Nitrospirae bacterium]|nr:transposase [Nitrospirota bacterium]